MKVLQRYIIIIIFSFIYCPFSKPHSGGGPGEDCGIALVLLYNDRLPNETLAEFESRRKLLLLHYYNCMVEGNE